MEECSSRLVTLSASIIFNDNLRRTSENGNEYSFHQLLKKQKAEWDRGGSTSKDNALKTYSSSSLYNVYYEKAKDFGGYC